MATPEPLEAQALLRRTPPEHIPFASTDEVEAETELVGQERALEAMRFGIGMQRRGYNLFVLGPPGIGKHTFADKLLRERAAGEERAADWCYVYDFQDGRRPRAMELPAGMGPALRDDLDALVDELRAAIPAVFEREDYRARVQEIQEELEERHESAVRELQRQAREDGVGLVRTPAGFTVAPIYDGEVLGPSAFKELSEDAQEEFKRKAEHFEERLKELLRRLPALGKEGRERVTALNRELVEVAVDPPIRSLAEGYAEHPQVAEYLSALRKDAIDNADAFLGKKKQKVIVGDVVVEQEASFRRYRVNAFVTRSEVGGAPVVYLDNPTFQKLCGRLEHRAELGALVTDFTLIRAGALHEANGGYLVLDARKLLRQPFAWEALKRALFAREARIESASHLLGLTASVTLEPEPIPLDIKVVLLGERLLYYLLHAFDPDFPKLFKVAADFEDEVDRTEESTALFARLIAARAREEELRPFDRGAVARVIDHAAREAGDAEKLDARLRDLTDLLEEADWYAAEAGGDTVGSDDVQRAIDARIRRADRIRERSHEAVQRGFRHVRTEGERVAQINGLSVSGFGRFRFGQPVRVTATVRPGSGEVVDIEREVELGGALHSKGVLILTSLLGARYAQERPLSLSASVVFEQSYGPVEGDSASLAELCALLSALAGAPIRQSLAVTGSIDQHGRVQAIGGVNEKIEGFFDVCSARGLTGAQGVIIPRDNLAHLMLRQDVVDAVAGGRFRVWAVEAVDEALELLTGVVPGAPAGDGRYPEATLNGRVQARLEELAEIRRQYARGGDDAGAATVTSGG
jgi:lon-related putative ATP-dependent protease